MAEWLLFTRADAESCGLLGSARAAPRNGKRRSSKFSEYPLAETRSLVLGTDEEVRRNVGGLRFHLTRAKDRVRYEHGRVDARGRMYKLPRAHKWRPYRLVARDALLAAVVMRSSQLFNAMEVDALLMAQLPGMAPLEAARAVMIQVLSDAVKTGSSLAVRFDDHVAGGPVPSAIVELAELLGVELGRVGEGWISPAEGRALYLASTGFSAAATERLKSLHEYAGLSIERVCYLVHHGLWELGEVEWLLLCAAHPEEILRGEWRAEDPHLHGQMVAHGRAALLGGYLQRALETRVRELPGHKRLFQEEDRPRVQRGVDVDRYARTYRISDASRVLDSWSHDGRPLDFQRGVEWTVLLRPWDLGAIGRELDNDLDDAAAMAREGGGDRRAAVVVPQDFHVLVARQREALTRKATSAGVELLVCPWNSSRLDQELERRVELGGHARA